MYLYLYITLLHIRHCLSTGRKHTFLCEFHHRENKKTYSDFLSSACDAKADLVFVLDASASVGEPNFRKVLSFVTGMLADASIDSGRMRIGLLTYSTDVNVSFYLHQHTTQRSVYRAVLETPYIKGILLIY